MGETEFKTNAAHYFFKLALQNSNISKCRRQVIEKGLLTPDEGICEKCRHPRLNKGYLNVHDDYCCTPLFLNLKAARQLRV